MSTYIRDSLIEESEPNFLESLFGLYFAPRNAVSRLMGHRSLLSTLGFFVLAIALVFGPLAFELYYSRVRLEGWVGLISLIAIIATTGFFLLLMEASLMRMLGIRARFSDHLARFSWAALPASLSVALVFLFDYYHVGRFSIALSLAGSREFLDRDFTRSLPFAFLVIQVQFLMVLCLSLAAYGQMALHRAIRFTLVTAVHLYLALCIGLIIGDTIQTGKIDLFMRTFVHPDYLSIMSAWGY